MRYQSGAPRSVLPGPLLDGKMVTAGPSPKHCRDAKAGRSVAFSAGTRNSLVILPLAFAVPGAVPVLPAIIVTQTLVELVSELIYVRFIGKLGASLGVPKSLKAH